VKRRGFTLIELMVVIAIIIILAAIAIPNYLSMTARAKKSRVASDFAALATALETYRTDWNTYPVQAAAGSIAGATVPTGDGYKELTGAGALNAADGSGHTAAGDTSPIVYVTTNILASMVNPYDSTKPYKYLCPTGGTTWTLSAANLDTTAGKGYFVRKDTTPTLADAGADLSP